MEKLNQKKPPPPSMWAGRGSTVEPVPVPGWVGVAFKNMFYSMRYKN